MNSGGVGKSNRELSLLPSFVVWFHCEVEIKVVQIRGSDVSCIGVQYGLTALVVSTKNEKPRNIKAHSDKILDIIVSTDCIIQL